jgi:hypothetical protein
VPQIFDDEFHSALIFSLFFLLLALSLSFSLFLSEAKKLGVELAGHEITQPLFHQTLKTVPKVEKDVFKKVVVKRPKGGG